MPDAGILQGLRLFIVEDETIIAMMLEDMLVDLGCTVVGRARNVAAALEAVREKKFDGAILDVNLCGERADPVADALVARGLPFVFATGYGRAGVAERFEAAVVLQKPFEESQLRRALLQSVVKA